MTEDLAPGDIAADYFDGQSARRKPVRLHVAAGQLHITGDSIRLQVPVADVQWPERTRHGARVAHLREGGSLQAHDALAWDAWARSAGLRESWVVTAQQNWRATFTAAVLLVLLAAGMYQWGVPLLARATLALTPVRIDRTIGEAALRSFESRLLLPSQIPAARQQALRDSFTHAVERAYPAADRPEFELRFHTSPALGSGTNAQTQIGPNAFALPGGVIVITDELVKLLEGRDDVVLGVLGHEYGHVRRRHGMRMLVQATAIGTVASVVWGDFNSMIALAPVLLGQSAYSRGFEREADADSIHLLRANSVSPEVMVELFERLRGTRKQAHKQDEGDEDTHASTLGIALASHPLDTERMRFFRDAAR